MVELMSGEVSHCHWTILSLDTQWRRDLTLSSRPPTLDPLSLEPLSLDPLSLDPLSLDASSLDPLSLDPLSLDPLFLDALSLSQSRLFPDSTPEVQHLSVFPDHVSVKPGQGLSFSRKWSPQRCWCVFWSVCERWRPASITAMFPNATNKLAVFSRKIPD